MRAQSINPVVSSTSFTGGGDPIALLQAIFAASAHEMRGAAVGFSDQAVKYLETLSSLRQLEDKVETLAPAGDGKSVLLGSTLASGEDLKAQIEALDFSITTQERYNLSSKTTDKTGKLLSTGAKHLATTAEMAAAEAGKLVTGPTAAGVETRSVTFSDGSAITYTLYKNEKALTATVDDTNTLKAQITAKMDTMQLSVTAEIARAQAFANAILEDSQANDRLFKDARKQEAATVDKGLTSQRQTIDDSIGKRVRDRRDIEQHHKVQDSNKRAG